MPQIYVIARGFGGEPKRLIARSVEHGRVVVGVTGESDEDEVVDNFVSLPHSSVFKFDASVFERLIEEWEAMAATDADTWRQLEPFGARALANA